VALSWFWADTMVPVRAVMPVRGDRPRAGRVTQPPVATGRAGSVTQLDQEPT
jgi:hypothetical protein